MQGNVGPRVPWERRTPGTTAGACPEFLSRSGAKTSRSAGPRGGMAAVSVQSGRCRQPFCWRGPVSPEQAAECLTCAFGLSPGWT